MTKRAKPSAYGVTLPERCGLSAAHQIAAAGAALPAGGKLQVYAGSVARMSCASVVALISAAKTLAETGGGIVVHEPNAVFTDAFADLGLFEFLMRMEFAE
jgi:anti-anti-sigma regulatory factor